MRLRPILVALVVVAAAAGFFVMTQRPLSGPLIGLATHREVADRLQQSMTDQKRLAELAPEEAEHYREEFGKTFALSKRLRILDYNQGQVATKVERFQLAAVLVSLLAAGAFFTWRAARSEKRLQRLEFPLSRLAAGDPEVKVADHRRDLIGNFARMVERASHTMARDRRRLAALENLGRWQEAARRQAHEIRTPLSTARLELDRLQEHGRRRPGEDDELVQRVEAIRHQLERLSDFTRRFASFARLPSPRPEAHDLVAYLRDFAKTFAEAWPNLTLRLEADPLEAKSLFDPDMLRQVLINLCENSAAAVADPGGTVTFTVRPEGRYHHVQVTDSGPGVAPALRAHLFEPYVTSAGVGEGMGLGLSISKKILLEHGGDLELIASEVGACFDLTLPADETRCPES